jgi:hypothetical protein
MPGGDSPESAVALRKCGGVVGGRRGPAGEEPPQRPVEVGPADGGTALHDCEAIGSEDKRWEAGAQLLGRTKRRTVQTSALCLPRLERDLDLDRSTAVLAGNRDSCAGLTEADQLRVRTCARREPLSRDMEALEEICLSRAVRPDGEDEAGMELELVPGVRAIVAERELLDDQAATG